METDDICVFLSDGLKILEALLLKTEYLFHF